MKPNPIETDHLKLEMDRHYKVLFVPTSEDVIEVQTASVRKAN